MSSAIFEAGRETVAAWPIREDGERLAAPAYTVGGGRLAKRREGGIRG